ncbi:MAG: transposase [Hyphomicrobiaceae bacterium]
MPTSTDTSERRHIVLQTKRRWGEAEKRGIVAETRAAGANVSLISRRHGVAQSLIYQWRKTFPLIGAEAAFVPVAIATLPPGATAPAIQPAAQTAVMIEIELAFGRKLRVASDVDVAVLLRIIVALETA